MIKKEAIDALRLYEGDIRIRNKKGKLVYGQSKNILYRDENAYRTLNALLFPEIHSEYSRIHLEKHQLNIEFVKNIEGTIEIFYHIFSLMCKMRNNEENSTILVRRVDRKSALQEYKKGIMCSFVSTSKKSYDTEFAEKDGIVLLEIQLNNHIPYLDLEKVLGDEYKNYWEREVLLSPFLSIDIEKIELEYEERKIKDMNGKIPVGKYRIVPKELVDFSKSNILKDSKEEIREKIIQGKDIAIQAIETMNKGEWDDDFISYKEWKKNFQNYLHQMLSDMWYRREE
ncbi:MAG TPA: hypothetical protein IAC14_00075 [Candidatus Scybalomonas excrementigallinarum]|nr:hypothetical protein [Candidatus Scybalomonas excrementigallinarum]